MQSEFAFFESASTQNVKMRSTLGFYKASNKLSPNNGLARNLKKWGESYTTKAVKRVWYISVTYSNISSFSLNGKVKGGGGEGRNSFLNTLLLSCLGFFLQLSTENALY